ncbi:MerR family transcriptional regulator [Streptomyces noursei]|uniref:MerR family transcriptional regulator n=1 Tax=Streptomyces noursei TaxID=1971 RepID=A0A059VUG6_STRNR|nr:MerR family transcriptional regulator [Streptomyces noursei]AIA01025.1 MerR family transcriptional regulator [Streptomyces noursei]AKA01565.1 transcriptional regulator [Streptomyces noursei ZPM]UWS69990.1 MerR family transcriptional regulator [Streptomyces noursei]GCB88631.1 MerR family transcriptional regulator [Streptomyces noursei]
MDGTAGGAQRGPLRTVDVARESGYSVQQVRDLERLGVIPPAARADNGYRGYAAVHVHALRAYRGLAGAVGPVAARQLLPELRTGTLTEAAATVNELHVRLARERDEALRAQRALHAIRTEAQPAGATQDDDAMTITELAEALRVRTSTLRFWEQEGLVTPERVTSLRARRYGVPAIRAARIVAALRSSGYGIPAVREVIGSLERLDGPAEAERILQGHLDRIAVRTVALLRAGADLATVVSSLAEPAAP